MSNATISGQRSRKYVLGLPFWVWVVLAAAIAVAIVQTSYTDQGMANGFTWPILVLTGLVCLVWFTLFSSYSKARRWSGFAVVVLLVAGFVACVNVEGATGNMIPILTPRPWLRSLLSLPDRAGPAPIALNLKGAHVDLATTTPHDFPQFLGPKRDLAVRGIKLARDWSVHPPEEVWRKRVGAGWSGFSAVNGYAVTLEQRGSTELVTCYQIETGELQWAHGADTRYETWIGGIGPRSTPTIHLGKVYVLGATGRFLCLDGASGQPVWQKDLLQEFGLTSQDERELLHFGRANSPLIVDDVVIVPAGGPKPGARWSLAAFHKDTGALVWKGGGQNVSYSSPAFGVLAGVAQVVCVNEDTASGHDVKTGKLLWEIPWPGNSSKDANVSQAVPLPPDRVFISKGYGGGATLVKLTPAADGTLEAKQLYHEPRNMRTKLTNVTIKDGHVYGLSDGVLECLQLDTGRKVWRDGRYGHGQILRVDDLLLVLSEDGELALVEATPERPNHVLGQIQALEGRTWNNLALYGSYLLLRNGTEAVCYRLATTP
jgi:outer membrane protein assembly factor BamB